MLCSGSFPEAFGVAPANVLLYQEYHWKTGECWFAPRSLVFYLWLLHRGLQGRSARDKSKMKNHGAFLLLLLAFWNKRRYNRMEDDSWGKLISSSGSLAEINPLRYRGYYYDTETGFYYLQSRYYDPVVSRFINADSYASTGDGLLGYNMFAYCGNNPVCYSDPTGHFALVDDLLVLLGLAVVTAVTAIVTAVALPVIQEGWNNSVESFSAKPKTDYQEKAKEQVIPKERDNTVYIYRYGGINPGNLTPRDSDESTGLSFSTIPKRGAARTTIDELNASAERYMIGLGKVQTRNGHKRLNPLSSNGKGDGKWWILITLWSYWTGIGLRKNRQRDCILPGRSQPSMCFCSRVIKRTIKMCGITALLLYLKRTIRTWLLICSFYLGGYGI